MSPKESEPRMEGEPLSHLEKEGPSVLLLQGVLQLRHVALQLQVFIPGVFHLLWTREMLRFSAVLVPGSPTHTCASNHSHPARGRGGEPRKAGGGAGERDMGCLLTHALTLAICLIPSSTLGDTSVSRPGRKGPAHQMDRSSGNSDILELTRIREKPCRLL